MPVPYAICKHLRHSLNGLPSALRTLVGPLPADSPFWDQQPDPDRFTPREVLAHLADWDPIFQDRLALMLREDVPTIPRIDEERLPIDHGYALQDPVEALTRFCENRAALVRMVEGFGEDAWARTGRRGDMGELSVSDQVVLVAIHDGYHLKQMSEYVDIWREHHPT